MEVEQQGAVQRQEISDGNGHFSYEPRCDIHLKEPGRLSLNRMVGTLVGRNALYAFKKGDKVAINCIFCKHREKRKWLNKIIICDIKLINDVNKFCL